MTTAQNTLGTALSLIARKAAAFDFVAEKELMINYFIDDDGVRQFWLDKEEDGVHQLGTYPTALEAVEAFMKDGEGK